MGVASGCGCKEVYRFHHTTYPYSSCICSFFAAASLLFVHFLRYYVPLCNIYARYQPFEFYIFHKISNCLERIASIYTLNL